MPQLATAFDVSTARPASSSLAETLALVAQAGSTIVELRARLAGAERTIALLTAENLAAQAELRALRHGPQTQGDAVEASPNRSHLDDTLAALAQGLGATMVRARR